MPFDGRGRRRSFGCGKWTSDSTAFDLVERRRRLTINQTLRNQGNRSPFDLWPKEISHRNARLRTNLRREHHLIMRFDFDNGHKIFSSKRQHSYSEKRVLLSVCRTEAVNEGGRLRTMTSLNILKSSTLPSAPRIRSFCSSRARS